MDEWRTNLVDDEAGLTAIIRGAKRIAVLGIKTEEQSGQAAFYVPEYLANAGLDVIPVPVYYPEVTEILGKKVFRRIQDVPGPVDIVDVFRRPADVEKHVDDILAAKPKAVWMQSGIRNDRAAEAFARAGIKVVQDRCLMVEHRRLR